MGKRKEQPTQEQIDELANRAQDIAIEISSFAENISIMQPLETIDAATKLNQLIEAAGKMNRMLLALELARHEAKRYAKLIEDRAREENRKTPK